MTSDVAAWMTGAGLLVDGGAAKGERHAIGLPYRPFGVGPQASLDYVHEGAQVGGNMRR
jgi:hypothetical protein